VTYSICVREGDRFGVAAAGALPAIGGVCPHASAAGAVATQGVTDPEVGRRCLDAVADGAGIGAAVVRVLADEISSDRLQIHGVDARGTAAHTGPACPGWAGHAEGAGRVVAGTALAGADVLETVERTYVDGARDAPLAERLVAALAAGERAGGDRRDLPVGSAAVVVARAGDRRLYDDLRVDASDTPVADLRATYRAAMRGYEAARTRYQTEKE
jgi:uncharacterized Ntn-hydrolase superfamily protein